MPIPHANINVDPCSNPNLPPPVSGASSTATPAVSGLGCGEKSVGVSGESRTFIGVFGQCESGDGIQGVSSATDHAGVAAINEKDGFGLWATSKNGEAGFFAGKVTVTADLQVNNNLNVSGEVMVSGDVKLWGGDVAERFPVSVGAAFTPGMVMSIGDDGNLVPCSSAYDKRVVGVVSGAGNLKPAVTLRHEDGEANAAVVALAGTVFCMADASYGPIDAGDLLTASVTPGHAMKAVDFASAFGAVIGKALAPMASGRGLIPMVVSLR